MHEHAARVILTAPSLAPVTHLCVSDVTDGHAALGVRDGRALAADGRELLLLVASPGFDGRTPLARQRLVLGLLGAELRSGALHSVRLRCLTPGQWEARGRPRSFRQGAPCAIALGDAQAEEEEREEGEEEREGGDAGGGGRLRPFATPSSTLSRTAPRGARKISIDGEGDATACECGGGSL